MRPVQTLAEIKALLDSRGVKPKRSLGQNFLIDHNLIRKLVDSAGVGPNDVVLEVGPGTGTMSEELLERGVRLVACELDDVLADVLRERLGKHPRFTLVHGDCLEDKRTVNRAAMRAVQEGMHAAGVDRFHLVANLPYGAGTPLMSALLVEHAACATLAVTIQREVGDRLLASPGSKDFGPLAVLAQALGTVERVATAPPECFWPRPEVTSAMVLVRRRPDPLTADAAGLSEACRVLFAQRRKQIGAVLGKRGGSGGGGGGGGGAAMLAAMGIAPQTRAEQLSVDQIVRLAAAMTAAGGQDAESAAGYGEPGEGDAGGARGPTDAHE